VSRRRLLPKTENSPPETAGKQHVTAPVPPNLRVPSFLAFRFHQLCLGIMAEVLAPEGLRWTEYGALTTLDAEPGLDQQRLAARIGIDKVSAGQLIDRLEQDGLVSRLPHPTDRRARALYLTATGLALRRRLQPAALAAQDRILAPLGVDERRPLIELLTRVVEGHGAYTRPGNGRLPPRRRAPVTKAD
jgi:MarR family transcriptional regulator, temperature-dependent positive regulator of motility